jgi:hypothetical protein
MKKGNPDKSRFNSEPAGHGCGTAESFSREIKDGQFLKNGICGAVCPQCKH